MTSSYSAVVSDPPEYPEVALMTPLTCWNTACIPQKQPPAKTAVGSAFGEASPTLFEGGGTGLVLPSPAPQALTPTTATIKNQGGNAGEKDRHRTPQGALLDTHGIEVLSRRKVSPVLSVR